MNREIAVVRSRTPQLVRAGILFGSLILFCFSLIAPASGEESDQHQICEVRVRVLQGTRDQRAREVGAPVGSKLDATPLLQDVKSQLKPLPFEDYQIVDTVEEQIRVGNSRSFRLREADGEESSLRIEPHGFLSKAQGESKILVSINWRGSAGEQLLDTKLKFENGKSMVIGTDKAEDTSTILCVKFDCHEAAND